MTAGDQHLRRYTRRHYPGSILILALLAVFAFDGCKSSPAPPPPLVEPNKTTDATYPTTRQPVAPLATNPFENPVFHKCYDGDTCTFTLPGIPDVFGDHIAIRLVGIDAPEIKGRCQREKELAMEARDFLTAKLKQAHVIRLRHTARDKYFRVLAEIVADGEELNELLLQRGLAVPYNGGTKTKDWCAAQPEK